jgi:hypothetical protein
MFKRHFLPLAALAVTTSLLAQAPALPAPAAKVLITAQEKDGKRTALRVVVGRNGFAPPM